MVYDLNVQVCNRHTSVARVIESLFKVYLTRHSRVMVVPQSRVLIYRPTCVWMPAQVDFKREYLLERFYVPMIAALERRERLPRAEHLRRSLHNSL